LYYIDKQKKPKKLSLFLAKPNTTRKTIAKLKHVYGAKLVINFGKINELSFSLPYEVEIDNKLQRNPHIDECKEKYFIKSEFGDQVEWYVISKITKTSSETDQLQVQCYSLGYQMRYQRMLNYVGKSSNGTQVLTDCLRGTGWKLGHVNPSFNFTHRQFDVSNKTKLDFLYEIAETFEGILQFDTDKKEISLYREDELSSYKGFIIKYGKYLEQVEEVIDSDEVVTRLYVTGSDGIGINSVNPTGQPYIDDFSYFLYPFEMDENENVLTSSNFMEDELCIGLVKYNKYVDSKRNQFANMLTQKKMYQEDLTRANNDLDELKIGFNIILDSIKIAQKTGNPIGHLLEERKRKEAQITYQKSEVSALMSNLKSIDNKIAILGDSLKIENHLSEELLNQLTNYIHVDEWSDENQTNEEDLYAAALKKSKEINSPPVNITTDIVNFFEIVDEQHNWDRFGIGDIVKIQHSKLNILVKTKLSVLEFDFDSLSIKVSISNSKKIESVSDKIIRSLYTISQVKKDYGKRKKDWITSANNFNLRNDRISTKPTSPTLDYEKCLYHTENDNGSVNLILNWTFPDFKKSKNDADNIDGFFVFLNSSETDETYVFGSEIGDEEITNLSLTRRSCSFQNLPPNKYYTLGIKAYRSVDEDIHPDGILFSDIVTPDNPKANPYLPMTHVDFKGTIQGYSLSADNSPYSIPVRNESGRIVTDIEGDASSLGGKSADDFVSSSYLSVNMNQTEAIAHRGYSGIAPENTVPAFQLAIANNFDSLECDVQISKDGHTVVIHDDAVNRTTNGTGNVKDLTLAQLRSLDASNGMSFFAGTKIPLFDEYLKLAKGNSKFIYPEVKGYRTEADIPLIVNKIVEHGMESRCVLQSFNSSDLDIVRQQNKTITLGYLCFDREQFLSKLTSAQKNGKSMMLVSVGFILSNVDLIDMARSKGIDVGAWTVNNSKDIQELKKVGIVRIMMNHLRRI
jgi:phage minor structural protein